MKGKEARGMITKYKGNWTGRRKGLRIVNKGEYVENGYKNGEKCKKGKRGVRKDKEE